MKMMLETLAGEVDKARRLRETLRRRWRMRRSRRRRRKLNWFCGQRRENCFHRLILSLGWLGRGRIVVDRVGLRRGRKVLVGGRGG